MYQRNLTCFKILWTIPCIHRYLIKGTLWYEVDPLDKILSSGKAVCVCAPLMSYWKVYIWHIDVYVHSTPIIYNISLYKKHLLCLIFLTTPIYKKIKVPILEIFVCWFFPPNLIGRDPLPTPTFDLSGWIGHKRRSGPAVSSVFGFPKPAKNRSVVCVFFFSVSGG